MAAAVNGKLYVIGGEANESGFGGGGFGGGAGGFGGGGGGFADGTVGVVDTIDGNTVTITTQSGPVVVELSEATVFQSPTFGGGDSSPETREGLEIGRRIAVQGPQGADGNLVAETITLLPQAPGGRFQGAGVGGGIQNDYIDTVWEFNPEPAIWTLRTSMPTARSAGGTAVINGKIYVVGGRPPQGQDFAVYDPATDSWTSLPALPTARNHFATAAIDGKIYVIGGQFGGNVGSEMTNIVEVFDPSTNAWTEASAMPTARAGINGIAVNGCLYVFGGEGNADNPSGVFDQTEVYNPASDTWQSLQSMPVPVHGVNGAAIINGGIYLPGGGTERGGSSGSTTLQVFGVGETCGL